MYISSQIDADQIAITAGHRRRPPVGQYVHRNVRKFIYSDDRWQGTQALCQLAVLVINGW